MKHILSIMIFLLILTCSSGAIGQSFKIDTSKQNITRSIADELSPQWSSDNTKLIYHSNRNGNWDIFYYDVLKDTNYQLTENPENEKHPVWIKNDSIIVFDSDKSGKDKLYSININTGVKKLLFERNTPSRQASFPGSELLVYFSGYDILDKKWKIYSYEFLHNNLNQLIKKSAAKNHFPKVSPDGSRVVFMSSTSNPPDHKLMTMNWYGNIEDDIDDYNVVHPSWGPSGLKIYFVSDKDNRQGEVYSIWVDGSHLERLTHDQLKVQNPVVSNDGRFMALSVLIDGKYDICIVSLDEY